jgi:hypothetical protein
MDRQELTAILKQAIIFNGFYTTCEALAAACRELADTADARFDNQPEADKWELRATEIENVG